MKCNILKNLYIKSNGDIRCDDDYGERVLLGKITADAIFSPSVLFNNEHYTKIRESFARDIAPWGETCEKCAIFSNGKIEDALVDKRIHKIQLEPSLHCSLLCPSCSRINQLREGRYPLLLTQEILRNFLEGLARESYQVSIFEFCGQGEPLNHPDFVGLCTLINEFFPHAKTLLITNANFDAVKKLQGCHLDEIIASCDGSDQLGYEQYRINGSFEQCIEFMRGARVLFPKAVLRWKYILFKHNDSDADLIRAQVLAEQLNVDNLLFISTQYGPISERFLKPDADSFPLRSSKVTLKTHPYVRNMLAVTTPKKLKLTELPKEYSFAYQPIEPFQHHLDRISLASHEEHFYIYVDGWCVPQNRMMKIFIKYGATLKYIQAIFAREDVSEIYNYPYASGFRLVFPLDIGGDLPVSLQLQIGTAFFGSAHVYDYEFGFTKGASQRDPLVIPIHFWSKKTRSVSLGK